jgi:alcohol dehydrogenase class IV
LLEELVGAGVSPRVFRCGGEPTIDHIREGKEVLLQAGSELVIGMGGGSVLDAGKALAAMATNPGDVLEYLEVIGAGKALVEAPLPYIAVPTTAGTGAEVTRNAVLLSPSHRVKVSLRSPLMLPWLAVVDPELTYSLPADITAQTGMDALTQLIEPFVSNQANPLTDSICLTGLRLAARALPRAAGEGTDRQARRDMALASLFGGLALANAKLGAVHGFAGPLGGRTSSPHGAVCARLLPEVMTVNVEALQARQPGAEALERYRQIARILVDQEEADTLEGVKWVADLCERLAIPPLGAFGVTREDFPELIDQAARSSSMKGNPIELTREEMAQVLSRAW